MANPHSADIGDALTEAEGRYALMVARLRNGDRLPEEQIALTLTLSERTLADLVRDTLTTDTAKPWPGDRCERSRCDGQLIIYTSRRKGAWQTRFLMCNRCKTKPTSNKQCVPASTVLRRRPRKRRT